MKRIKAVTKGRKLMEWDIHTTAGNDGRKLSAVRHALLAAVPGIDILLIWAADNGVLCASNVWKAEWESNRQPSIADLNKTLDSTRYVCANGVVLHRDRDEVHVRMTFPVDRYLLGYAERFEGVMEAKRSDSDSHGLVLHMPGSTLDKSLCQRIQKHMSFEY